MIKIYPKLWYITQQGKEGNLSYMCQYETTESGGVAANVKKMQDTGSCWSNKSVELGNIIDNLPTEGLYVGCSVSRWSTSNKLFRVEDLRGFTVEIPTDNLATLLHHTTVVKGVIQDECVWGREGNNHILLPVNSEPYKLARKDQDTIDNKLIAVNSLKQGDWVKFFGSDTEYYFHGKVKVTWKVRGYRPKYLYNYNKTEEYSDWYEIEDSKYINLFFWVTKSKGELCAEAPTKPKIVEVVRNEHMEVDYDKIFRLSSPERVNNRLADIVDTHYYNRIHSEVINIKHKGE